MRGVAVLPGPTLDDGLAALLADQLRTETTPLATDFPAAASGVPTSLLRRALSGVPAWVRRRVAVWELR